MGEKLDVDETSNLKEENVKVPPRDEPTLKEKLKVSNGMLRHSLGGAVIFISLQHFIFFLFFFCAS